MKRKISAVIFSLILVFAFVFNVCAVSFKDVGVNYSVNEGYIEITSDNFSKNGEIIKELGYTISTISKYFKDNGILLMAVSEDTEKQVQIKCTETDFTLQTGDISVLDNDSVITIAEAMLRINRSKMKIVEVNGVKYIETRAVANSSESKYSVIQYTTIRNGKLYTLSYYDNSNSITDSVIEDGKAAVEGLKISKLNKSVGEDIDNTLMIIVISLAVLLACVVIVYVCITFFLDIKKRSEESGEGIIKRRNK